MIGYFKITSQLLMPMIKNVICMEQVSRRYVQLYTMPLSETSIGYTGLHCTQVLKILRCFFGKTDECLLLYFFHSNMGKSSSINLHPTLPLILQLNGSFRKSFHLEILTWWVINLNTERSKNTANFVCESLPSLNIQQNISFQKFEKHISYSKFIDQSIVYSLHYIPSS